MTCAMRTAYVAARVTATMQDVLVRRQWDRYDSGEETRDVLEVRAVA